MLKIRKGLLLLVLILIIGAFLRFYKLDWGDGLLPHPDEYHIVASVSQLSFPNQMHPHFFSYGTVTIYLIYFTKQITNLLFEINPFLIGRFFSALFSTLTILIIYLLVRNFLSAKFSQVAAFLVAVMPGLIQQAHFATPESALMLFTFTSLLFLIYFAKHSNILTLVFSSIFFGLSLGVKISGLVFIPTILIAIFVKKFKSPLKIISLTTIFALTAIVTLVIVAPFIFLDFKAFRGNLEYEGGLAAGKLPVFYTRQFINTLPIIFQLEKILPFSLGPFQLVTGLLGLLFSIFFLIRKFKLELFLVVLSFLLLFGFNGLLFAKWTRFIAPTFPFFAIFASFLLDRLYFRNRFLSNFLTVILLTTTVVWTGAFFSIYLHPDVRATASKWVEENTQKEAIFLLEGGNMVDIPINGGFRKISLDFYALEESSQTRSKIAQGLEESEYFLVQSRRVFMNHMRLPDQFPKTANFYNSLFNGSLGFELIKQFDSYPQLGLFGYTIKLPDEGAEETWSVFDHPVIRIFQKNVKLTKEQYANFLD